MGNYYPCFSLTWPNFDIESVRKVQKIVRYSLIIGIEHILRLLILDMYRNSLDPIHTISKLSKNIVLHPGRSWIGQQA